MATGKEVILGEWGIAGSSKAVVIAEFVTALGKAGVAWMYWNGTNPGKGAADFEVRPVLFFRFSELVPFSVY